MKRVLLLEMPFASLRRPSIGLSLLKAVLESVGVPCDLHYANLRFARVIGQQLYRAIADGLPQELLVGDFVFAGELFGERTADWRSLAALKTHIDTHEGTYGIVPTWILDALPDACRAASTFLERMAADVRWADYALVGFGSMFQQNAALLSLARRIAEIDGAPPVVVGGANCEGEMGLALHEAFPWIDFVCRGEGEALLVDLVRRVAAGARDFSEIEGLVWRDGGGSRANGTCARGPRDLDELPAPTFDDWFEQFRASGLEYCPDDTMLPFETSRGCWWGQKSHCTFCGLNGASLKYRSKSPGRALREILGLRRYRVGTVHAVDNILPRDYMETLLPALAAEEHGLQIFYEVKSNLKRAEVRALAAAGVRWVQPGIESLSTPVLRLMRKGVTALQNVRLLRWCAEFGVAPTWNILYGFPGESPQDYATMSDLVETLAHLYPPTLGCNRVRLDRFSPLFEEGAAAGITDVRPFPAYAMLYPPDESTLRRLAYFFEYRLANDVDPDAYIVELRARVRAWQDQLGDAAFVSVERPGSLLLWDTRVGAATRSAELTGIRRNLYAACDQGATRAVLERAFGAVAVAENLPSFVAQRWVTEIDNRFLALAVPMTESLPPMVPEVLQGPLAQEVYLARMEAPRQVMARLLALSLAPPAAAVPQQVEVGA